MLFKIFLLTTFFTFSIASFQEVRIGSIDAFYKNRINKEQLKEILNDIENTFESQLQKNIFDYSKNGKEINIVYVSPSKLEKKIEKKVQTLKDKEKKINDINDNFPKLQEEIDILKSKVEYENSVVNEKVNIYNTYIKNINQKRNLSSEEFEKMKSEQRQKKKTLNNNIRAFTKKQRKLQRLINVYNQKVNSYNNQINQFNRISNEIETMSRNFKKVKGMTFGLKEIKVKTIYRNGKTIRKKEENHTMNKIEIYGFQSLNELKATLAHEIGHLVGIPHISAKNALMNPILQKNQIENLSLTKDDIKAFRKYF